MPSPTRSSKSAGRGRSAPKGRNTRKNASGPTYPRTVTPSRQTTQANFHEYMRRITQRLKQEANARKRAEEAEEATIPGKLNEIARLYRNALVRGNLGGNAPNPKSMFHRQLMAEYKQKERNTRKRRNNPSNWKLQFEPVSLARASGPLAENESNEAGRTLRGFFESRP